MTSITVPIKCSTQKVLVVKCFRPPLVYKNLRVFGGFFIGIFGFCPKKPQKSGLLGKKVAVYLDIESGVL